MSIPLVTALGALQLVPTVIALSSGAKDGGTRAILITGAIAAGVVALFPYVGPLRDLLGGRGLALVATVAAVVGVLTAVRNQNRIIGTLTATAGVLMALIAWGIVGDGW